MEMPEVNKASGKPGQQSSYIQLTAVLALCEANSMEHVMLPSHLC